MILNAIDLLNVVFIMSTQKSMAFLFVWQVFNALANQKLPPPLTSNCSYLQRSRRFGAHSAVLNAPLFLDFCFTSYTP